MIFEWLATIIVSGIILILIIRKLNNSNSKKNNVNNINDNNESVLSTSTNSIDEFDIDTFMNSRNERMYKWSAQEKALLLSIIGEIAMAGGDMKASGKSSISKSLFGVGVLEDINEIQNLADKLYSKNANEADFEKIALDFKKLSPDKKQYVEQCILHIVKVGGEINPKEIAIAKHLTGMFKEYS